MLKPSDFNNAVPQFPNGSYASNPINPQYIAEPDAENYNKGTEPLQTLPAQWWNWFLNKFTSRFNKINIYVKNIFNELAQVLSIFNITPDGTEQTPTTSQLKTVFETCYPQYVKTETTGTAVGCIPTVGTALGTTNNNILVTDSTGKLKPSGITVGTAAGCDATLFARKTEVDALYGNVAGTPLGTAAVGTCTTFARSDHVHPLPTFVHCAKTVDRESWSTAYNFDVALFNDQSCSYSAQLYVGATNRLRFDTSTGVLTAAYFNGTLHGNADTASYACQATGPIPFDAAEEAHPLGARVRAVAAKGITEGIGYRSRMAIGLMYCGAWAHGLISVGCDDDGTEWDDYVFPVGNGGIVITSNTIGSQSVSTAISATNAGVTCTFGLAVGRRNETMRQWAVTWDDGAVQCDIYKAICWAMNDATYFGTMSIVGSIGCTTGETTSYTRALERYYFADRGHTYRFLLKDNTIKDIYATCTNTLVEGRIGGVY